MGEQKTKKRKDRLIFKNCNGSVLAMNKIEKVEISKR